MSKKIKVVSLLLFLFFVQHFAYTQVNTKVRLGSVELFATVDKNPNKISLNWLYKYDGKTNGAYSIDRKLKSESTWTNLEPKLNYPASEFEDLDVESGVQYEYRIIGTCDNLYSKAYGYINTGIEIPMVENRGGIIVLIDNTFQTTLAPEITQLREDLEGDGWQVVLKYVSPTAPVTNVKSIIVTEYNATPGIKALFILGHVPVPYSGNMNPDGHGDHKGAWPTDAYYADVDGTWTDATVNTSSASDIRNKNTIGDGKFDQNILPSDIDLQVGRVDLSNMPMFGISELQLLKNYLKNNHEYRKKYYKTNKKAILYDNFGTYAGNYTGNAFALNGWRNFAPLVHPENTIEGSFLTALSTDSYQWAYACGAGSPTNAVGLNTSSDNGYTFLNTSPKSTFNMIFGSYFGDWEYQNVLLKQPLCTGTGLTNVWAGNPMWYFHHMAMGENIGYSSRLSQNNNTTYFAKDAGGLGTTRGTYMTLLGDPTLRSDIVSPVSNLTATFVDTNCNLSWTPSPQTNIGYNIYVKNPLSSDFKRINENPISGSNFIHKGNFIKGTYKYFVRTVVLETTASGTYYNMSEGISTTANMTAEAIRVTSLSLSSTAVTVLVGQITELIPTILPTNATNTNVIWTSSDPLIAKVEKGIVTALTAGNATITATSEDGAIIATCTFSITAIPVTGISLSSSHLNLLVGGEAELIVPTVLPQDASNKSVIWTSSNVNVATVSKGIVKAIANGSATITATTVDGSKQAICNVNVSSIALTGIRFAETTKTLLTNGEASTLIVNFTPANASNKNLIWETTNINKAAIVNGVLTPGNISGTVTITAKSEDGGFIASCLVTVQNPVTGVVIKSSDISMSLSGSDTTLVAIVVPTNASNKNVRWTSSNENVVTVANGLLHAVGMGTALITVTTEQFNKTASTTVTVTAPNSVNDLVSQPDILFFNAKTDEIIIRDVLNNKSIEIYNTIGKLVQSAINVNSISVTKLPNGFYIAKLNSQGKISNLKFIKQR